MPGTRREMPPTTSGSFVRSLVRAGPKSPAAQLHLSAHTRDSAGRTLERAEGRDVDIRTDAPVQWSDIGTLITGEFHAGLSSAAESASRHMLGGARFFMSVTATNIRVFANMTEEMCSAAYRGEINGRAPFAYWAGRRHRRREE